MNQHKRVWIYCRVAHPGGDALHYQKQRLLRYAEEHGFEVVGMTAEVGAGHPIKRPGLDEVFSAAENGRMDTLFVDNTGRIARGTDDFEDCFLHLNKLGVELLTLSSGVIKPPPKVFLYIRLAREPDD